MTLQQIRLPFQINEEMMKIVKIGDPFRHSLLCFVECLIHTFPVVKNKSEEL
jgi:hypothetical protein